MQAFVFLIFIVSWVFAKPLNNIYGPPQHNPPPPQYNPPSPQYIPPPPQYNPPLPQYNPPPPQYNLPHPQYNPPHSQYNPLHPQYNPPHQQYNPPPSQYNPPSPETQYGPPSSIPELHLKAPVTDNEIHLQQNLIPPTPSSSISKPPNIFQPIDSLSLPQKPIIQKYFYIHSAPEEPEETQPKIIRIGQPRKHYRVVFIKTSSSNQRPTLEVIPAPLEEKTVIYVLSKHSDASDIQADLNIVPTEPSKPEVYFIKYKTKEEAVHAQEQIQAQYNSLGGTSEVSDEGLAPVSSVIGALNRINNHHVTNQSEPQRNYLPSNT